MYIDLYMLPHVSGTACIWYHMYFVPHVSGTTCIWYRMYFVPHINCQNCALQTNNAYIIYTYIMYIHLHVLCIFVHIIVSIDLFHLLDKKTVPNKDLLNST